jgi:hypothetical protein
MSPAHWICDPEELCEAPVYRSVWRVARLDRVALDVANVPCWDCCLIKWVVGACHQHLFISHGITTELECVEHRQRRFLHVAQCFIAVFE